MFSCFLLICPRRMPRPPRINRPITSANQEAAQTGVTVTSPPSCLLFVLLHVNINTGSDVTVDAV